MRVLNYLELEGRLDRSGIGTAAVHQRRGLETTDVEVVTSPWRLGRGGPFDDYDLAHINLFGPASVAVVAHARQTSRPVVAHAHVTAEDFAGSFRGSTRTAGALRRYLRWFYSRADVVLCPSEHTRGRLEAYPVEAPIEAVTNGVDHASLEGFEALREPFRERYDLDGLVVFSVGNVFERKGLTTFCRLAESTPHRFCWFGPYDTGPLASPTVRRWVRDPPENCTFTGWIDDKRGAFAAGDIFCFPTKEENQGIAVLEAMACGKPVILRDIPVFREYYTDGEDCLLCSDRAAFAEAIERVAGDEALRERLGSNARETAASHGLDRVGERLAEVYEAAHAGR